MRTKAFSKKETVMGIITILCAAAGLALFFFSYTTGYYVFGQMNSIMILMLAAAGILVEIFALLAGRKWGRRFWVLFLTFAVTALLTAGAIMLLGDRVEGIGNCIITDYDAGHGGEEAIYRSLAASVAFMVGVIVNIIGSFSGKPEEKAKIEVI